MNFYKYNGLGNDFIIINCLDKAQKPLIERDAVIAICDRHIEVGADGVINVMNSDIADAKMIIINSDGSRAEMCGNGIRCFSKFVYDNEIFREKELTIETDSGIITVEIKDENGFMKSAKVHMGVAFSEMDRNEPLKPSEGSSRILIDGIKLSEFSDDKTIFADEKVYFMNIGVPHMVVFMNDISDDIVCSIGSKIEKHLRFKDSTNVNFAKIINRNEIELKTWERGAGFTLACGTGACATYVAARLTSQVDEVVTMILRGGKLVISMDNDGQVFMEGPASFSYKGTWDRNNFEMR